LANQFCEFDAGYAISHLHVSQEQINSLGSLTGKVERFGSITANENNEPVSLKDCADERSDFCFVFGKQDNARAVWRRFFRLHDFGFLPARGTSLEAE
jgi:hypothetical protein